MPCDHIGPPDVFRMAEEALRQQQIPEDRWPGTKVTHAENTPGTMWASVVIDVERRGPNWIVTRLDRRSEPVPDSEVGLRFL